MKPLVLLSIFSTTAAAVIVAVAVVAAAADEDYDDKNPDPILIAVITEQTHILQPPFF